MAGPCTCRHCVSPAPEAAGPVVHEPVELPDKPRPFRVHQPGRPPRDCVLHPDGRMTMQAGSQVLTSMLSFDEMRETSWAQARIEWDPAPLPAAPVVVEAGPEPVQEAFHVTAA